MLQKFKDIKPCAVNISDADSVYFEKLCALGHRSAKKIWSVIGTAAAAVILLAAITVWAIIGNAVRGGDFPVVDNDNLGYVKVVVKGEKGQKPKYEPINETDDRVNRLDNGDIAFNGKDAYVVGYTDEFVILRPSSFSSYEYIQVMTDTTNRDIVINEVVLIKGYALKLEEQIPFPSDEPRVPIAYKADVGFEMTYKFDPNNINGGATVKYIGDGFGIVSYEKHYIRAEIDFSDFCVGDYISISGTAQKTESQKYTLDDSKEITVDYFMNDAQFNVESTGDFIVAKPVIYLYPENTTEVSVKIDVDGELSCVYPEYNGAWEVTATPDGTLYDKNGRQYYCLYWEADMYESLLPDKTHGFVVKGEDTAEFLREKALKLGLNEKEANEFIIYWLPQMEDNPYNYVYFSLEEYTDAATLDITPAADTVIRFAMLWQPLDKPIEVKEQSLPVTPERNGFTAVEWGGAKIK